MYKRQHLDFHGTMEAYRDAKGLLFRQCAAAVLNLDDEEMCIRDRARRPPAGKDDSPSFFLLLVM